MEPWTLMEQVASFGESVQAALAALSGGMDMDSQRRTLFQYDWVPYTRPSR